MNLEIEPALEYRDPVIVSVIGNMACLGAKEFHGVGQFRYRWMLEHMNRSDVIELAEALRFAAEHMEDPS